MKIVFSKKAAQDFALWQKSNPKVTIRIAELLEEIAVTPEKGKGKPEPLRGNYSGYWSRRINIKDRLVYRVHEDTVEVVSLAGHYGQK